MPRKTPGKDEKCVRCGGQAEVLYRQNWWCGDCLNPDPSSEYLRRERERALGAWGGVSIEMWQKM